MALHGLLALNRSETIYYTATTDSAGGKLDARCLYRVIGRDPPARWWSITAYGADHFLIDNEAGIYSVQPDTVARLDDGSILASLSAKPAGNAWLPSGKAEDGAKRVALTLRLYNAPDAVMNDLAGIGLPRIVRVG